MFARGNSTARTAGRPATPEPAGTTSTVLGLAAQGTIRLVVLCARFWRTTLVLICAPYLVILGGWWALAQLAVFVFAFLGFWRWLGPVSFAEHVRPVLRAWWARWFRYGPRWSMLASRHGLEVWDTRGMGRMLHSPDGETLAYTPTAVVRAKLMKVQWTPATDRLLVKLPAGLGPGDVEKIAEPFAHATGSMAARVRPHKPGSVWIELLRRDPLTTPIDALAIPTQVSLGPVPVGQREDGTPWRIPVLGTHVLVAGATGSGKGSVLWSLLRGLAPAIATGSVEVWGFDPKGGMELALGRGLFTRFFTDDPETMADALEDCAALMHERTQALAGHTRLHAPTTAAPLRLVVIDELAALTALCERKTAQRVEKALGRLLTQGRAPGCAVIAFLQDPGKDVIAYRNLFPTRIALRLSEAVEVDMILGEGARARGAHAHRISPDTPGVGFIRHEVHPDPVRVRSAYVTDEQIRVMAASHAAGSLRPVLPALTPAPAVWKAPGTAPGTAAA